MLGAAWDARADAPTAADELREWAQYCGVSRSWRAYFGGRPLRLAFDAPLTKAQARPRSGHPPALLHVVHRHDVTCNVETVVL